MIIKLFVPWCLRACKICVVFVVELNLKVTPVIYGRYSVLTPTTCKELSGIGTTSGNWTLAKILDLILS